MQWFKGPVVGLVWMRLSFRIKSISFVEYYSHATRDVSPQIKEGPCVPKFSDITCFSEYSNANLKPVMVDSDSLVDVSAVFEQKRHGRVPTSSGAGVVKLRQAIGVLDLGNFDIAVSSIDLSS